MKPFSAYRKCAALKWGLRYECKDCQDDYNRMFRQLRYDRGLNWRGQPYKYEACKNKHKK